MEYYSSLFVICKTNFPSSTCANLHFSAEIFTDDRKNPNGCPIRGTFYISHQYTNYRDVQYLWNVGHEIAAHSVT